MSRPTRSKQSDPEGSGFRLPPEVTVSRAPLDGGIAYSFRHAQLGELGRLVVKGTPDGETSLVTEVAGDVGDPMLEKRREVLEPLCLGLSEMLGPSRRTETPPARPGVVAGQVAGEEVRCERCGARVAFLVFAEHAVDAATFEDYARLMFAHYSRFNVPTYLIGPALGGGPLMLRPADILHVWPERHPVERLRPDEFNPRIEHLATHHCK